MIGDVISANSTINTSMLRSPLTVTPPPPLAKMCSTVPSSVSDRPSVCGFVDACMRPMVSRKRANPIAVARQNNAPARMRVMEMMSTKSIRSDPPSDRRA